MKINKLLLDTHVFLWWRANDPLLHEAAISAIANADVVFVSAATAWEAAIKASLGRLDLPGTVESGVEGSGFEKLQISFSHAEAAAALPPHHGDPFDRMLVAQAVSEGLTLITHDRRLEAYEVSILWT
ncbi:MAG: type II toxin-antitoxin system VapC family toxin [Desulfobacterales bacterium]|jgi:PIN domain nuclease of toxin-antitoxin system